LPARDRVTIRRAAPKDIATVNRLNNASIRELCSSFYTSEQIRGWTAALKPGGYLQAMELCDFLVAVDGPVVGMCIFNAEKAEITALYVSPPHVGKGVGTALVREVEAMAREGGLRELHHRSTLNAVGFYEKMGYSRIEWSVYVLPGGTELPCMIMAKCLKPVGPSRRMNPGRH
jgi:GNAT superfamily N-acetyltransferase